MAVTYVHHTRYPLPGTPYPVQALRVCLPPSPFCSRNGTINTFADSLPSSLSLFPPQSFPPSLPPSIFPSLSLSPPLSFPPLSPFAPLLLPMYVPPSLLTPPPPPGSSYRRAVEHGGHEDVVPGAVDEGHVPLQLPGLPVLLELVCVVASLRPISQRRGAQYISVYFMHK